MSDSKDIIQRALDFLTGDRQDVRVLTQKGNKPAVMWFGRITGLAATGDAATITLSDVRANAEGHIIPGHILLDVDDVLDITAI